MFGRNHSTAEYPRLAFHARRVVSTGQTSCDVCGEERLAPVQEVSRAAHARRAATRTAWPGELHGLPLVDSGPAQDCSHAFRVLLATKRASWDPSAARSASPRTSLKSNAGNCSYCETAGTSTRSRAVRECIDDEIKCENGTTLLTIHVRSGRFRFEATSFQVYECPFPENCVGGTSAGEDSCRTGPLVRSASCARTTITWKETRIPASCAAEQWTARR